MPNSNVHENNPDENSGSNQSSTVPGISSGAKYPEDITEDGVQRSRAVQVKVLQEMKEAEQKQESRADEIRRRETNLKKRARELFTSGFIQYPDVVMRRSGDAMVPQASMTDMNKFTVLDALFGVEEAMPHHDLFRGRIVDHEGTIVDDHYPVVDLMEAFAAANLKGVSAKGAREAIKEWALARKRNDLINNVKTRLPEWDEVPRLETKIIEMFDCLDTELNRLVSKYFWLSLYSRVMIPGSLAPIVLSLFGAQGCGKSRFTKRLAQIITGNEETDSVQLNLDGDRLDFLRNITGQSVIASVGEMSGFRQADLNKIKDFVTRTADQLHYKFEGTFMQQRQFIIVMDGNKYEGLQRDETGNRRFYPMFCGQLPDEDGQPQWRKDFIVPDRFWEAFEDEVWQIMAECAAWFDENGEKKYEKFVGEVVSLVKDFNAAEAAADRGTLTDALVDPFIDSALMVCEKWIVDGRVRDGKGGGKMLYVDDATLIRAISAEAGRPMAGVTGFASGLKKAMEARGAKKTKRAVRNGKMKGTVVSWKFAGCDGEVALSEKLAARQSFVDFDAEAESTLAGLPAHEKPENCDAKGNAF